MPVNGLLRSIGADPELSNDAKSQVGACLQRASGQVLAPPGLDVRGQYVKKPTTRNPAAISEKGRPRAPWALRLATHVLIRVVAKVLTALRLRCGLMHFCPSSVLGDCSRPPGPRLFGVLVASD